MNLPMMIAEVVVGALLGHLADRAVRARHDSADPWGTFIVNISGSLDLGTFAGVVSTRVIGSHLQRLLDDGLCGAPAPYSAFSRRPCGRPVPARGSTLLSASSRAWWPGSLRALAGFVLAGALFA